MLPSQLRRRPGIEALEQRAYLTAWYVSASAQAGNGTLAQPFSTIQAAAAQAQPGDTVYIEAGTYHEAVRPTNSGLSGAPITYQPYQGQSVVIDGANPITGFTASAGNGFIYQAQQSFDLGDGNNQVFEGGQMLTEARWPNSGLDPLNPTMATASAVVTNVATAGYSTATYFNAGLTQPSNYWVGATIHLSPRQNWTFETGTVLASSPGSVTFIYQQLTSSEVPNTGDSFYLTGKLAALDFPGEFYHDPGSNTLYVYTSDSLAPTNIESKARQLAFDLSGKSYINLVGLQIHACTINTDANSSHDNIIGVAASFVSQQMDALYPWGAKYQPISTGILLNGSFNTIAGCSIAFSSGAGISVSGAHNTVSNCSVSEVDYSGQDVGAITLLSAQWTTVVRNTLSYSGRAGVEFYFSPLTTIENNVIHDIGLLTTDTGGIYTWQTNGQGSQIAYNVIYNAYGGGYGNCGILIDDDCSYIVIHHNLVYNANIGLKMNTVSANDGVFNNTLIGAANPRPYPNIKFRPSAIFAGANPSMPNTFIVNNILIGLVYLATGAVHNHNVTSEQAARFANAAGDDFTLTPGSTAIDAGATIPPYTDGYIGIGPDVGAYEYGIAPWTAGAGSS